MSKKREGFIIGLAITAGVCYLASRIIRKKERASQLFSEGIECFNQQKYQDALNCLLECGFQDFETLHRIYECHEKLGNLTGALIYLNKCISLRRIESLISKRAEIFTKLEMNRDAFKDLFLLNLILKDNDSKENASDFLKKICNRLAKSHKSEEMASPVNYSDFFDTLFFLKDKQDPAIVFLNSGEYEKCYAYVQESEDELHRFILGCFYLVNGDFTAAMKILENSQSPYSNILAQFIKSRKLSPKELEDLQKKMETEEDTTVLYYMSKIFENVGNATVQYEILQKCIRLNPNSVVISSIIVWYIRQKNHSEAMSLIKASLKEYPESLNLLCIALEYYIIRKNLDEAIILLEKAEKIFGDDPRIFLFKFMVNEAMGRVDTEILKQGIRADPKYFKLYFYLGDKCTSGEESVEAYRKALECARTYDEVFNVYQLLIVVETQNELFKEFPDLFIQNSK